MDQAGLDQATARAWRCRGSRCALLLAAGHAPQFPEPAFDGTLLRPVRETLLRVLDGHLPAPAIVVGPAGRLVAANAAFDVLAEGVAPSLLQPPINVLRLALHAQGMAPRIANLSAWSHHVIASLRARAGALAEPTELGLLDELERYAPQAQAASDHAGFAVPLILRCADGELELITAITTFATAADVTLAELALEAFLPGNQHTADVLRRRDQARQV